MGLDTEIGFVVWHLWDGLDGEINIFVNSPLFYINHWYGRVG